MKKIIAILTIFTCLQPVYSQQQFLFTHYMYNGLGLNPAYAGVHEGLSTSFIAREQWAGIEGAPSTMIASVHSPINHRSISLGALVYRDKLGLSSELGTYLSYAYRIQLGSELKLSMGLQATGHNYRIDYTQTNQFQDLGDNLSNVSELKWNFGAGLLLHDDKFYLGLSAPQLLDRNLDDPDDTFTRLIQHYYMSLGYAFELNNGLVVKPNVLLKAVQNAPVQVDLNTNVLLAQKLWLGISYRSFDSIDALIALNVNPQMQIGYAIDLTQTEIEVPSHEIMLNYIFNLPTTKIVTPRYF